MCNLAFPTPLIIGCSLLSIIVAYVYLRLSRMQSPTHNSNPLVCPSCWDNLFAFDSFQIAWSAEGPSGGFSYTITWGEIQESAAGGCSWCKLLATEIPDYLPFSGKPNPGVSETTFEVRVRFVRPESEPGSLARTSMSINLQIDDVYSQKYEVHSDSDDPAGKYIAARELVYQVSSPATFKHASDLLKECSSATDGHELCLPTHSHSTPLPTRVIDCLDPLHPRISKTRGSEGIYAALSYVWGEDQAHKTTTDNLDTYVEEVPVSLLPQTIKDAIASTHSLGLRYLWIDSLCIIQNSDEDKAQEIAQMRKVYQNAFVTIIAASAKKASGGFLEDRRAPHAATRLPFRCPDGAIGIMSLRSGTTEPEDPVDSRAWCFQERLLAGRKLVFASDTVRYECSALSVNIGNANAALWQERVQLPPALLHTAWKSTSLASNSSLELETAWNALVTNYTQRGLSNSADKLPAFYGIVELFHREAWSGSRYLAGLWERNLLEELLWQRGGGPRLPRPEEYRAPSWSWAAINGTITPAFQMHHYGEDREECEILDVGVTLKWEGMMFGEVVKGALKLRVAMKKVWWEVGKEKIFSQQKGSGKDDEREGFQSEPLGNAYADALEDVSNIPGQVWAIPLRSSSGVSAVIEGLILAPANDSKYEGCFRRVGLFQIPTRKSPGIVKQWSDAPRDEVVVI